MLTDNSLEDDVERNDAKDAHFEQVNDAANNQRWRKCVALKESESDITTQEEFYKFDFQVKTQTQHSTSIYISMAWLV